MKRLVFALDLANNVSVFERYEHAHRDGGPPLAVSANIRKAGVREMEIFRVADRLVMVVDAEDHFAGFEEAGSDDPEIRAWSAAMGDLQRPIAGSGSESWAGMTSIYKLSRQP